MHFAVWTLQTLSVLLAYPNPKPETPGSTAHGSFTNLCTCLLGVG